MAIMIGIGEADRLSIFKTCAPRSLYLQEKSLYWILGPDQRFRLTFGVGSNLSPRIIRHHPIAVELAANALSDNIGSQLAQFKVRKSVSNGFKSHLLTLFLMGRGSNNVF